MELTLVKTLDFYDIIYLGCGYEIIETKDLEGLKVYEAKRKDGLKISKQEEDSLIEQFKMEQ